MTYLRVGPPPIVVVDEFFALLFAILDDPGLLRI
jgi:hypothetical protein